MQNNPQSVQDKPAEVNLKLNNVLTGLVLAAILWVGNSIIDIKDIIASLDKTMSLQARDITYLEEKVDALDMALTQHLKKGDKP